MPDGPVRTCLGCRRRDEQSRLLRVVADTVGGASSPVVDVRRREPGRGAYVHPDTACVSAAVKRRAFGRALRAPVEATVAGAVLTAYLDHSAGVDVALGTAGPTG